ncbi:MAG: aminotransferase class I/II-fold pyridoxal phosphate-dependent enzyme, partial [Gemmiger sp.]|nr:aminotransferase class I/II-fold pyridoxal phosphate-dependent enzyme [Gemmiger sp.]
LPVEWLLCGNGAADIIYRAVLAVKPARALVTAPTFAEYEAALAGVGCQVERYTLASENGFRVEAGILQAIRPGVGMVFLCEPNNPTGLVTPRSLLDAILARCRAVGAVLVLDECFGDFLPEPAAHTLKQKALLAANPNLIILSAFTKLYAMAGVRLGYGICAGAAQMEAMRGAGQPWAVSTLAQAAGLAALREKDYVENVRRLIATERPWLATALTALGLRVVPGQANYLLFEAPCPLCAPLRQKGILLRSCADYAGLGAAWYRTAVRTHPENARLVAAIQEVLA